jgi:lipopolysaccharide assembly outer membrane protein LptD (OstA)
MRTFVFLAAFICSTAAVAQERGSIVLEHADSLAVRYAEGNSITTLYGNVRMSHEGVTIGSNRAVWYEQSGQTVFLGDVVMEDSSSTMTCDRIVYREGDRTATATGGVRAVEGDGERVLTGNRMVYRRDDRTFDVDGSPVLSVRSRRTDDVAVARSTSMTYDVREKVGWLSGDVEIDDGARRATGDSSIVYAEDDRMVLFGSPRMVDEYNDVTGDTIVMTADPDEERVREVRVIGRARAVHTVKPDSLGRTTPPSVLEGDQAYLVFDDDVAERAVVIGQARSVYYSEPGDSLSGAHNEVSGDSIIVGLREGDLAWVSVQGGAEGVYYHPVEQKDSLEIAEDSVAVEDTVALVADTLAVPPDSLTADTTAAPVDTIRYRAERIDYADSTETFTMYTGGRIEYKQFSLSADLIEYAIREQTVSAWGSYDPVDSTLVNTPVMRDGTQQIVGQRLSYNIETRRGRVVAARTEFEQAYYKGTDIRRLDERTYVITGGMFTTCDHPEPHYHFASSTIKVIERDRAIARPIVFYVGRVPLAYAPYFVFSIVPGRHSGFLPFDVGSFERADERYVRNFGYYWAASEYWDLTGRFDFYEKSGYRTSLEGRYGLRYILSGAALFEFKSEKREVSGVSRTKRYWKLQYNHRHDVDPTVQIASSGSIYSSTDYAESELSDRDEQLTREIRSQGSITKRWEGRQTTLVLSFDHTRRITDDVTIFRVPSARFSSGSIEPFPYDPGDDPDDEEPPRRFYHNLRLGLSSNAVNYGSHSPTVRTDARAVGHAASMSMPMDVWYLTVNPTLNYREAWYDRHNVPDTAAASGYSTERGWVFQRTFSTGVSVSTTLYGLFPVKVGPLLGLRHVVSPSVGFSYAPRFAGQERFPSVPGISASQGRARSMTFSLGNVFQAKYASGEDERRVELLSVRSSLSRNFLAEQRKWSNVQTSARSSALRFLLVDASLTHDLYDPVTGELRPFNPLLTSFSTNARLDLSSGGAGVSRYATRYVYAGDTTDAEVPDERMAWELRLSYGFSESRFYDTQTGELANRTRRQFVEMDIDAMITPLWELGWRGRYDMVQKRLTEQSYSLARDLHCWQATVEWSPSGFQTGWYVRVFVKVLPEIKVEQRKGLRAGY